MKFMLMMHGTRGGGDWGVAEWAPEDLKAHVGFMKSFNRVSLVVMACAITLSVAAQERPFTRKEFNDYMPFQIEGQAFENQADFIASGRRCANNIQPAEAALMEQDFQARIMETGLPEVTGEGLGGRHRSDANLCPPQGARQRLGRFQDLRHRRDVVGSPILPPPVAGA